MSNNNEEVERLTQRVKDLELTLGQNNDILAVTFKLTPVLNNLMGLLLALPNVTPEMIRQRLEIAPDAKVAIHRLRRHLDEMHGKKLISYKIEIESRRNLGYWLEESTKAQIRQTLAEQKRATAEAMATLQGNDEAVDDLMALDAEATAI